MPAPVTKDSTATDCEVPVAEGAKVDDWLRDAEAAEQESNAGQSGDQSAVSNRAVVKPVPARSVFKNIFQAAETDRHQHNARIIRSLQK